MENRQKKVLLIGLEIVLVSSFVLIFAAYFDNKRMEQSSEIESNQGKFLETNDKAFLQYPFCGQVYSAIPTLINNVDVIQRITEITAKSKSEYICNKRDPALVGKSMLIAVDVKQFPEDAKYKSTDYFVTVQGIPFKVDVAADAIYLLGDSDDVPVFFGTLTGK
jgi:hypothetical protein